MIAEEEVEMLYAKMGIAKSFQVSGFCGLWAVDAEYSWGLLSGQ